MYMKMKNIGDVEECGRLEMLKSVEDWRWCIVQNIKDEDNTNTHIESWVFVKGEYGGIIHTSDI